MIVKEFMRYVEENLHDHEKCAAPGAVPAPERAERANDNSEIAVYRTPTGAR